VGEGVVRTYFADSVPAGRGYPVTGRCGERTDRTVQCVRSIQTLRMSRPLTCSAQVGPGRIAAESSGLLCGFDGRRPSICGSPSASHRLWLGIITGILPGPRVNDVEVAHSMCDGTSGVTRVVDTKVAGVPGTATGAAGNPLARRAQVHLRCCHSVGSLSEVGA
jgi:hypothetical protein